MQTDESMSSTDKSTPSNDETIPTADTSTSSNDEIIPTADTSTSSGDQAVVATNEISPAAEQSQMWGAIIEPWWKATLAILPTFLITRFIFLLLAYFGGVLFFVPNYAQNTLSLHDIIYRWYQWDAARFAKIATMGYANLDFAAFFPLFPGLMHALSAVTHLNIVLSGMVISNVAFLGMLIVLYRFVTVEFDKETAQRTVLYISIFPTAFFFFAGYNESLFLFFMLLSFYMMRRSDWWLAGLFGFLATLTRSLGIFLVVIFICEYLRQKWPQLRAVWQERQFSRGVRLLTNLPIVLLIPLGLLIYSIGLYMRFHDPLAFLHAQAAWRRGLSIPLVAPFIILREFVRFSPFTFVIPHDIIDLTAVTLFGVLMVLCFVGPVRIDKTQWTFALFGIIALTYPLFFPGTPSANGMYDPMPSMQRLVLEIFIGFIILARLGRRPWFHQLYLLLSLPLLAFFVLQFMTGHWTV